MDRSQGVDCRGGCQHVLVKKIADIPYNAEERRCVRSPRRLKVSAAAADWRSRPAVERVMGGPRYGKMHPATRTFQVLRIHVNTNWKVWEVRRFFDDRIRRPDGPERFTH
jgi:16S rRNA C1402 N4-methylase RsmH